jgi:hypothetical protein
MKSLIVLLGCIALSFSASGQGRVIFANSSSTLISADGTPMPISGTQQFIFAVFLAPSTTVGAAGQTALLTDPAFQVAAAYNTNSATVAGRLVSGSSVDVGPTVGVVVDYVVRGWSANAGATWDEARTSWGNGNPSAPMFIGSSVVGNNMVLGGGAFPIPTLFWSEVPGFNMTLVPEPSSLTLAGLGGAAMWLLRRRSH